MPAFSQRISWKKQAKLADELFEQGNYAEAAINYEEAWRKKPKKVRRTYAGKIPMSDADAKRIKRLIPYDA